MIQMPDLGAYATQAWIVSVTAAAMGLTKVALWIKQSGNTKWGENGNRIILARETAKFESQVLSLNKRVVELVELLHSQNTADRNLWAPTLERLVAGQSRMIEHMDEQQSRIEEIWPTIITQLDDLVNRIGQLPCADSESKK